MNITGDAIKMWHKLVEECHKGEVPRFYAYSFPGAYPVAYYTKENNVLCADCATEEADRELDDDSVIGASAIEVDIGDSATICDGCGHVIDFGWEEGANDATEGECSCLNCRNRPVIGMCKYCYAMSVPLDKDALCVTCRKELEASGEIPSPAPASEETPNG